MKNDCPLGFECITVKSIFSDSSLYCVNIDTCQGWTNAWKLPYWYNRDGLIVEFVDYYTALNDELSENLITSQYNWEQYFAEYGFAEAEKLPYFFRSDKTMMVCISKDNIYREEMKKTGYANAIDLPLQQRTEYFSPDTYEGFIYQEVDLFFCDDEAINAFNAGYANAVKLLPNPNYVNEIYCC